MLSTGVIGVLPPKPNIAKGLEKIQLSPQSYSLGTFTNGAEDFSRAILTTDTTTKTSTYRLELDGKEVCIAGCAKGSGMIHPNMATMLAFITTDAAVEPVFLQELLRNSTERSFHRISVDGDCSTNDSVLIFANGLAKNRPITPEHPEWQKFQRALERLCQDLAKAIVRDGEGDTKFIEIEVCGAPTKRDAALCAPARGAKFVTVLRPCEGCEGCNPCDPSVGCGCCEHCGPNPQISTGASLLWAATLALFLRSHYYYPVF